MKKVTNGFALLEIIIAISIFVFLAVGWVGAISLNIKSNRLSTNRSEALLIAEEGLNIVNHIKKTGWENISSGTFTLEYLGGEWILSSTPEIIGKYTREVIIEDAYRNTEGELDELGTIVDNSVKKITVSVSWSDVSVIQEPVSLVRYISNWEQDILRPGYSMLAYADFSGSDDVIKYVTLDYGNNWGTPATVPDFGVPSSQELRRLELFSSVTRDEKILITKHAGDGQSLYAQIWNGEEWDKVELLSTYSDNLTPYTRNYDGFYMENGDFVLVYEDYTTYPKYRIWDGENWSNESEVGDLGGYPIWIVARGRPNSNAGMLAIRDDLEHTNTFYWDGDSWSAPEEHATASSGLTRENIGFAWSRHNSDKGILMYNDKVDNTPNIKTWDNDTLTWGPTVDNENVGGRARIFEIAESPIFERFLACVKDSNRTINCLYTDLSPEWSSSFRITTNTNDTDTRSFSIDFESVSGEIALMVYSEGGTDLERRIPKYRTYNPASDDYSDEYNLPELGVDASGMLESVKLIADPITDNIMVLLADTSQELYALGWDGETNSFFTEGELQFTEMAKYGSYDEDFWYDFDW